MCRSSHQGVEVRGKTQRTEKFMLMTPLPGTQNVPHSTVQLYDLFCTCTYYTSIKTHQSSNQNTRHGTVRLKFFAAFALKGRQAFAFFFRTFFLLWLGSRSGQASLTKMFPGFTTFMATLPTRR